MSMVYVKPSPGGRIRMPERNFIPMPATGAWIARVDYYERLLIGGDVVICDPPAADEPVADAPADPSPEPEISTSKAARAPKEK